MNYSIGQAYEVLLGIHHGFWVAKNYTNKYLFLTLNT